MVIEHRGKWWQPVWCSECDVEMVYDQDAGALRCPKCGHQDIAIEADIEDKMERDINRPVREALQRFKSGEFLFGGMTADEVAETYHKYGRVKWGRITTHDYLLATLLRKDYVKEKIKAAQRMLAIKMGWDIEGCAKLWPMLEADLEKYVVHIPHVLYNLLKEALTVEGWRRRPEETLHEGYRIRGLPISAMEPKAASLYRTESMRWRKVEWILHEMYFDARKRNDRILCWIIRGILLEAAPEILGKEMCWLDIYFDPYPDDLLDDLTEGRVNRRVDTQECLVQMHLNQCEYLLEKAVEEWNANSAEDAAEEAVRAVAAREGHELRHLLKYDLRDYVEDLSRRLQKPEILALYDGACNSQWAFRTKIDDEYWGLVKGNIEAAKNLADRLSGVLSTLPATAPPKVEREQDSPS